MKNDFYIGWQPEAPDFFSKKIKRAVLFLAILVPLVAIAFVSTQRGFADSNFEFGTLTEMEGTLVYSPAPMLKTKQPDGKIQSVLLVGFGKKGIQEFSRILATRNDETFEKQQVKLEGTRIFHDGKMALELTDAETAFKGIGTGSPLLNPEKEQFGEVSLLGEILDPKCAFGVMKPGEGKPHRSCAVRCISGGIAPVFRMRNAQGESNYALLLGENGEPINAEVLDYVADQVRICGRLERQDDWLVLHTDPAADILRLQPHWMDGEVPMCNEGGRNSFRQ